MATVSLATNTAASGSRKPTLPHCADVYRETAMNILAMLQERLGTDGSHFRENPEDVATLLFAVQYLHENAEIADADEIAKDIATEAQRIASLALEVSAMRADDARRDIQ